MANDKLHVHLSIWSIGTSCGSGALYVSGPLLRVPITLFILALVSMPMLLPLHSCFKHMIKKFGTLLFHFDHPGLHVVTFSEYSQSLVNDKLSFLISVIIGSNFKLINNCVDVTYRLLICKTLLARAIIKEPIDKWNLSILSYWTWWRHILIDRIHSLLATWPTFVNH